MTKWVLVVCLLSLGGAATAAEEKTGKEKAIETLQKLKNKPHQLEVTVNRNGERKTMKVEALPIDSPDSKKQSAAPLEEKKPEEKR